MGSSIRKEGQAILEGSPVSGGFHLPESFFKITTDVWTSDPNEVDKDWKHNGHAMAVVGFDDNKYGGAFRILNSWGTAWADQGYVWMRYDDYAVIASLAYRCLAIHLPLTLKRKLSRFLNLNPSLNPHLNLMLSP